MDVSIGHSTPIAEVKINVQASGSAIMPTSSYMASFKPEPDNSFMVSPVGIDPSLLMEVETASANAGGLEAFNTVNISLGVQPYSDLANSMSGFTYRFDSFYIEDPSEFLPGDLVVFNFAGGEEYSEYETQLNKVNTNSISKGAINCVFIFKGFSGGTLEVMHKGFYDYELTDDRVSDWGVGMTIYANGTKLSATPSLTSNHWIRSLGFCVPNNDNKKRIWFEPDSTYVKRA